MKSVQLEATSRSEVRKKSALNSLRKEGRIPAVLYGGKDNVNFHVGEIPFSKLITTHEVYFMDLNFGDKITKAVISDVQFHPVTDRIMHADFFAPRADQEVSLKIPVRTNGAAIGVLNGGRLRVPQRKITVQGLLSAMPDNVEIEIGHLKIGTGVRICDLSIPGVEFTDASNNYAVFIKTARGAIEDELGGEDGDVAEGAENSAAETPA